MPCLKEDAFIQITLDTVNIDAISLLLVPHLDAIYFELLKLADGRGQDAHKWINPAFHMRIYHIFICFPLSSTAACLRVGFIWWNKRGAIDPALPFKYLV